MPDREESELVKDEQFKGIDPSPSAVREVLEKNIARSGFYQEFCLCTRVGEKK